MPGGEMHPVRVGVVGLGLMGSQYASMLRDCAIRGTVLAAVCHRDTARLQEYAPAQFFVTSSEMIRSGAIEAIIIATPHYAHTEIGIEALEHGLHVLVEKPISVHKADAERLLAAHRNGRQRFAAMFNVRTRAYWRRLREMVLGGELGEVRRISWTATGWFRTEAYYGLAPWRGTWAGEGGGVLLNQCPHQLDLLQWIFGMPVRVQAHCHFGKHHRNIEVEDEVTAYLEWQSGATCVFVASTGEVPGSHRVEIAAENGRVVVEDHKIHFRRNAVPMTEFSRTSPVAIESYPETRDKPVFDDATWGNYPEMIQNFVDAIRDERVALIAPAAEGLASVELANAMILSSLKKQMIELPMDGAEFEQALRRLGGK